MFTHPRTHAQAQALSWNVETHSGRVRMLECGNTLWGAGSNAWLEGGNTFWLGDALGVATRLGHQGCGSMPQ